MHGMGYFKASKQSYYMVFKGALVVECERNTKIKDFKGTLKIDGKL